MIELMISIAILTGVMGSVLSVQQTTTSVVSDTAARSDLQSRGLNALQTVASELRWANPASLLVTTEHRSSRIDLQVPTGFVADAPTWSSNITYRVIPSSVDVDGNGVRDEGVLVRVQDGQASTLTNYVIPGGFAVRASTRNLVLDLRLAKRDSKGLRLVTASASTSTTLRND